MKLLAFLIRIFIGAIVLALIFGFGLIVTSNPLRWVALPVVFVALLLCGAYSIGSLIVDEWWRNRK